MTLTDQERTVLINALDLYAEKCMEWAESADYFGPLAQLAQDFRAEVQAANNLAEKLRGQA